MVLLTSHPHTPTLPLGHLAHHYLVHFSPIVAFGEPFLSSCLNHLGLWNRLYPRKLLCYVASR